MNENISLITGSITSPKGFLATGVSCGIKRNNHPDLAIVASKINAIACGVFTQNAVKGHSLKRTIDVINNGSTRAIVINSGNANACVGEQGDLDANTMAEYVAELLDCSPNEILTGSTGVIGIPLDMDKIKSGLIKAAKHLDSTCESGHLAELAIMTTDTVPKEFTAEFTLNNCEVKISGMAKGSGMIHPNMATLICVITTDCGIKRSLLQKALFDVTEKTFNRISVDGDTSVCDMSIIMANEQAGNKIIDSESSIEYTVFRNALELVCKNLAIEIARDGEGATKLIEIQVKNALTEKDALKALNSIAKSPLFKTAMFGEDANWGRIITAIGYSGAKFNPDSCNIFIGNIQVCANGVALAFDEHKAKALLSKNEILIVVDLTDGDVNDHIWTCDFSLDYVKINGSYRS